MWFVTPGCDTARRRTGFAIRTFRLRIGFARQAPFVNYRRAMVDLSPPGSIFSKMLSIQQAA